MKKGLTFTLVLSLLFGLLTFSGLAVSAEEENAPKVTWIVNPGDGTMIQGEANTISGGEASTEHVMFAKTAAKLTKNAGTLAIIKAVFSQPINIEDYVGAAGTGYLHVNFYIEDADDFTSHFYFELSSNNVEDSNEMQYEFNDSMQEFASTLVDGWNHLVLPLVPGEDGKIEGTSTTKPDDAAVDWSAIQLVRIVFESDAAVWLDSIYVSNSEENTVGKATQTGHEAAVAVAVVAAAASSLVIFGTVSRKKARG